MSLHTKHIRAAILGVLVCMACGENPASLPEMHHATVTGTVAAANSWKVSSVAIQGSGTRSDLDTNGNFRLFGVPFGSRRLSIAAYISDAGRIWNRDTLIDINVSESHVDLGVIQLLTTAEAAATSSSIMSIEAIYLDHSSDTWSPTATVTFMSSTRKLDFGKPLYLSSDTVRILLRIADSCAQTCTLSSTGTPVQEVMRVGNEILTDWMHIPDSTKLTISACGKSTQIALVNGWSRWHNSLNIYTGSAGFYRPDPVEMQIFNPLLVPYLNSLAAVSMPGEDSVDFDLFVHKVNAEGVPDSCVAADTSGLIVRIRDNRTAMYLPPSPSAGNLEKGAYRVYIRNAGGAQDSIAICPKVNFVMGQYCLYKPRIAVNFTSMAVTKGIQPGETRLLGVVRFPECKFSAQ